MPAAGATRFSWEYDDGRSRLLDLYQRGKDKQWDAAKRIDWSLPVNPSNVMEQSDEFCPIYGSRQWDLLPSPSATNSATTCRPGCSASSCTASRARCPWRPGSWSRRRTWTRSSTPSTEVMDVGLGHAPAVRRGSCGRRSAWTTGVNLEPQPSSSSDATCPTPRWDMPDLGSAGADRGPGPGRLRGGSRHVLTTRWWTELLADVMQDEARHVAFGRLALAGFDKAAHSAERGRPRGVRGRGLLPDAQPVHRHGRSASGWASTCEECVEFTEHSPVQQAFRTLLFTRIVPCVKDIGLWGPKVQQRLRRPGRHRRRRGRTSTT